MKVLSLIGTAEGPYYFRSVIPGGELRKQFGWDYRTCSGSFFVHSFKHWNWTPDVLILQSVYHPAMPEIIRAVKKEYKVPIIYDIDDDLWNFPFEPNPFHPATIAELMGLADMVTCSSQQLARMCEAYSGQVAVIPNFVPDWYLEAAQNQTQKHRLGKYTILFSGGHIHAPDLDMIAPDLFAVKKSLRDQVQFIFQGCVPAWGRQLGAAYLDTLPMKDYFLALSSLEVDVALAPLVDNNYNRSKSYLKMLDYGAARFPVVATDTGEYGAFQGRIRLVPPGESWERPIFDLIDNEGDKNELAGRLNAWVSDHGKISSGVELWKNAIERASRSFTGLKLV